MSTPCMSPGPERPDMRLVSCPGPFYELIRFYPLRVSKLAPEYYRQWSDATEVLYDDELKS